MEPEQKLFLSVIIQAVDDVFNPYPTVDNKSEIPIVRQRALSWFKLNSRDYQDVCERANINAQELRKHVLQSNIKDIQGKLNAYRASI